MSKLIEYFKGDALPAESWFDKYALKDDNQQVIEETPVDMHRRMAREFARVEGNYHDTHFIKETEHYHLSEFGKRFVQGKIKLDEDTVFAYLDMFRWIIPQGSIMSALGNKYKIQSLSNCFVIPPPVDSYGGIFKTDQQIAQLEKRRGGVGTRIDSLRPDDTPVSNAAGTSTGAHSFMERYSSTTREVAQNGRRGALMILCHVRHPDIFKFVKKKKDRTKVTGANVTSMLTDKFMKAVEEDGDFICTFPIDIGIVSGSTDGLEYNKLYQNPSNNKIYFMKIRARELFDLIVEMAWENGEPGVAFIDRIQKYCPEGVYLQFMPQACNPCGEQWLQFYDACRLLAANLFSLIVNCWKSNAYIDFDKAYEVFYIQQRLADDIVDLEIEYIDRIIQKILTDPEPDDVKAVELDLWQNIRRTAKASRRTGCGFTGLADMLAALGLKYDSSEAIAVVEKLMYTKMKAELDCTIDLAILRGTFEGWDNKLEYPNERTSYEDIGGNDFFTMLLSEFPEQAIRMMRWGRRNVSWSTLAPTGTTSIVAGAGRYFNISGGGEPQFSLVFWRKRKVTEEQAFDEIDAKGDHWKYYPVIMGAFKDWWVVASQYEHNPDKAIEILDNLPRDQMEAVIKESPWYNSTANDIDWKQRIVMQAAIQKYTTNAISSTLNLPKDTTKETVAGIYKEAWEKGLKGVTVYRDGCRDGVLVHEKKTSSFDYADALKRPKEIDGTLHITSVKGQKYGVIIGKIDDKPYEIFAFEMDKYADNQVPSNGCSGKVVKVKKGQYNFTCTEGTLEGIQEAALTKEEQTVTRLISGMLRHGAKPQFIMEQIDKIDFEVVSFGKALTRILKKYCKEEEMLSRAKCSECNSTDLRMQEGCVSCNSCGSSKCG